MIILIVTGIAAGLAIIDSRNNFVAVRAWDLYRANIAEQIRLNGVADEQAAVSRQQAQARVSMEAERKDLESLQKQLELDKGLVRAKLAKESETWQQARAEADKISRQELDLELPQIRERCKATAEARVTEEMKSLREKLANFEAAHAARVAASKQGNFWGGWSR